MSEKIKVLVFGGSSREGSFNKKFAKAAAEIAKNKGAEVTFIDLKDYTLPVFDEDEEKKGMPQEAIDLKKHMANNDCLIISTPEYNGAVPGILKNAFDWMSRKENTDDKRLEFIDKPSLMLSASPGYFAGIRALGFLRALLSHLKMLVLGDQMALPEAHKAFDEHGKLVDVKKQEQLESYVVKLIDITRKLKHN